MCVFLGRFPKKSISVFMTQLWRLLHDRLRFEIGPGFAVSVVGFRQDFGVVIPNASRMLQSAKVCYRVMGRIFVG